jgi:hypothetical protein
VLKEGSVGRYEVSARKRRLAATNNTMPVTSLRRRLRVGVNASEIGFIQGYAVVAAGKHCPRSGRQVRTPE